MNVYKLDGLLYTAEKLASILRGKHATVLDVDGIWHKATDLDNAELIKVVENGYRHECKAILYPDKDNDPVFAMFGFEAKQEIIIETINVIDYLS